MTDLSTLAKTAINKVLGVNYTLYFSFLSFTILTFSLLTFPSTSSWAMGYINACDNVTKAVARACKNGVQDDFWISFGNCVNTEDILESHGCIKQAIMQHGEDRKLCRAQKDARNAICDALGGSAYRPEINPDQFLNPEQIAANPNPYFPLIPGMVKKFQSGDETITVIVTEDTIDILGVTCIAVRDIVEEQGELVEYTVDWYAQDTEGNVWYFGEISKNFEEGELTDLDGSWKAGVNNALPGIIMKANPMEGDIYRQEFALGEAEDMAEVISISETQEATPVADCSETCIVTREFLPIEPDAEELKYYAPGIGNILVIDQNTGDREELVEIIMP